jgi:hypothetical protein
MRRREFITLLGGADLRKIVICFRSFGFEFQGPCSAFTSWRARERDSKTFSLAAHNQELVLGHVTFVLQQPFQISLERGLCFNHRIERLLHRGRQIIRIDVLPLQFFACHCLAPNVGTSRRERERRRVSGGSESIIDPELADRDSLPDVHPRDLDGSTSKRSS